MEMPAKAGQEYWRRVLAAGGSTVISRWTLDPVTGVGECTVALPGATSAGRARRCSPRTRWSWRRCRVSGTS